VVLPAELGRPDIWRLRLIPPSGRIHDTHYIRDIRLSIGGQTFDVPLEFADIDDPDVSTCLDIGGSEWARIHNRHGVSTRALAQGSSMLRGGHVLLRVPQGVDAAAHDITVSVTSTNIGRTERLQVQNADARSGRWVDLELASSTDDGEWTHATFRGSLIPTSVGATEARLASIAEVARPDVEITDVRLVVRGKTALAVIEEDPFAIEVEINASREVPVADVWIKLTRADGFYVFWQSSGQVDCNLRDIVGSHLVTFHVDPNVFGAGDYEIEAVVANGFDVEKNWPHSQVYDRRVNALKFTVARRWKLLMFGPVNYKFPVTVSPKSETVSATRPH
jgi:lipopolysaccharide transport system ATP-binding protein